MDIHSNILEHIILENNENKPSLHRPSSTRFFWLNTARSTALAQLHPPSCTGRTSSRSNPALHLCKPAMKDRSSMTAIGYRHGPTNQVHLVNFPDPAPTALASSSVFTTETEGTIRIVPSRWAAASITAHLHRDEGLGSRTTWTRSKESRMADGFTSLSMIAR